MLPRTAGDHEEGKKRFVDYFNHIKEEYLNLRRHHRKEQVPAEVELIHFSFVQSNLLLHYLEELIDKLEFLQSQLPSFVSRSYAEEICEHKEKISAFLSVLAEPLHQ